MKKIILLIGIVFILTGCSVEYNLTIDKNLKAIEELEMTGTKDFFDIYYKDSKLSVVSMLLEDNKSILDKNDYKYEIVDDATPYVKASKTYDNLEEYCNNTIFYKQYFDKVECSVNDGVLTFKTIGFHQVEDDPERFDIKNLVINLKTDYNVESNADVAKKNVYSWYIDNTKEDYSMNFTIDSRSLANDKTQNNVLYLILSILFIVIMWSGYFVYKKVKEKN